MEGATLGLRYGLEILKRQGIAAKEIRLVGGGAKSGIWRRIAADAFGCPVVCPASPEAAAMGGVLQAMWCYAKAKGNPITLKELTAKYIKLDAATRVLPNKKAAQQYDALYERYTAFNSVMAKYWK